MESDTPTTPTTAAAAAKAAPKESKWNDAAHVALLGSVVEALHESGSSPAKNKDLIMKTMTAQGQDFTWEAIRQHLQKLRRKEGANSPKPAAAKKPAGVKKSAGTGTPRKRKGKAAPVMDDNADVDDDEEGDEFEGTPSKKAKTEPVIKDEDDE